MALFGIGLCAWLAPPGSRASVAALAAVAALLFLVACAWPSLAGARRRKRARR